MKNIWEETKAVTFGSADISGRLSPAGVLELFQEAAINHAEHLGVGREALLAARQGWVLSRISVVADVRPAWRDTVTVRSWPRGADRLFAVRDYDMRGPEGELLVRGRSGWLVLDLDKRRPLRPQFMMDRLPGNEGLDALPGTPLGLDARPGLTKIAGREARYSDIDYNGHMNNARYMTWVQDIAGPELLEKAGRFRLDLNYLHEVRLGEALELWAGPLPEPSLPEGLWERGLAVEGRRAGGEAVFRAELRTAPA
ncbi:MAG: acyl-ACP thioesterase [Spirochaetaceae bacterium]|jgi:acyl-ACP thioesterase|nr:acyl-ACP thioesterase [Spirochaetaceae bacterium]